MAMGDVTRATWRPLHWLRWLYLRPVRLYQLTLSQWLGGHCRFQPTCSQYFIDAVYRRGIVIGTAKGLWRICRCHPWSKGGWDPAEPGPGENDE